jgi:hypothetical protein
VTTPRVLLALMVCCLATAAFSPAEPTTQPRTITAVLLVELTRRLAEGHELALLDREQINRVLAGRKRCQDPFAGTARRVLRTNGS